MPPRFVYWTILAGGLPTAFRATEREELLPTFQRIKEKHPDAEMKYFAQGKLWDSPEDARAAREAERRGERRGEQGGEGGGKREFRGRDWRPGGEHRDPRQKFADAKRDRNQRWRKEKFEKKERFARDAKPEWKPKREWSERPPAAPKRFEGAGGAKRFDREGDQRPDWRAKSGPKPEWRNKPSGPASFERKERADRPERPAGPKGFDRERLSPERFDRDAPREKPHGDKFERATRPSGPKGSRPDRPSGAKGFRPDRPSGPKSWDRERPASPKRFDREGGPKRFDREGGGSKSSRPDRPSGPKGFAPRGEGGGGFKPRGGGSGFKPREGDSGFKPRGEGGGRPFKPRGGGGGGRGRK